MNNTTLENENFTLLEDKIEFYISFLMNIILLSTTIISEFMGSSKCKSNGIIHGIVKKLSKNNLKYDDENTV